MEATIERTYFPNGTNGILYFKGSEICKTIELPWKDNKNTISCIPEGKYRIRKRYSNKFKWHIELMNVSKRNYILIHPANNAEKELKGCIATVSTITGEGKGSESKRAFKKLTDALFPYLEKGFTIELIIKKRIL